MLDMASNALAKDSPKPSAPKMDGKSVGRTATGGLVTASEAIAELSKGNVEKAHALAKQGACEAVSLGAVAANVACPGWATIVATAVATPIAHNLIQNYDDPETQKKKFESKEMWVDLGVSAAAGLAVKKTIDATKGAAMPAVAESAATGYSCGKIKWCCNRHHPGRWSKRQDSQPATGGYS